MPIQILFKSGLENKIYFRSALLVVETGVPGENQLYKNGVCSRLDLKAYYSRCNLYVDICLSKLQ